MHEYRFWQKTSIFLRQNLWLIVWYARCQNRSKIARDRSGLNIGTPAMQCIFQTAKIWRALWWGFYVRSSGLQLPASVCGIFDRFLQWAYQKIIKLFCQKLSMHAEVIHLQSCERISGTPGNSRWILTMTCKIDPITVIHANERHHMSFGKVRRDKTSKNVHRPVLSKCLQPASKLRK